jgi:hypothetical protein
MCRLYLKIGYYACGPQAGDACGSGGDIMMSQILKRIKLLEKVLLILIFISIILRYFFHYGTVFDIPVFSALLSILYFPLGFYFLGRPSANKNIIPSVIFGLVYSMGIMGLVFCTFKVEGLKYPLFIIFCILILILVFLSFKLKSHKYDADYIYAQFFRIACVILFTLIVLI